MDKTARPWISSILFLFQVLYTKDYYVLLLWRKTKENIMRKWWGRQGAVRRRPRLKCDCTRAETRFRLSCETDESIYIGRGCQFSRLLAAEVCTSTVVMLDTPCWGSVEATHSIRQFPLHFPSRASPCAITFQLDCTTLIWHNMFSSESAQTVLQPPDKEYGSECKVLGRKDGDCLLVIQYNRRFEQVHSYSMNTFVHTWKVKKDERGATRDLVTK